MSDEPIAANRLKSFVERIENIADEIADRKIDLKAVYDEAKGEGFEVPILKKAIAERKRGEKAVAAERERIDLYKAAIQGELPLGEPKAKDVGVKLSDPDGKVLFEGTDREFSEAAERALRKSRAAA